MIIGDLFRHTYTFNSFPIFFQKFKKLFVFYSDVLLTSKGRNHHITSDNVNVKKIETVVLVLKLKLRAHFLYHYLTINI